MINLISLKLRKRDASRLARLAQASQASQDGGP
jgi:hypothetical protein